MENKKKMAMMMLLCVVAVLPAVMGWIDIEDTKDARVIELAEFAVAKHNEGESASLRLKGVVSGQWKWAAGNTQRLFKLILAAEDGSYWRVFVNAEVHSDHKELVSFKQVP